jgi:hypothetical protein
MEPFATVADLEARWRPLSDTERVRAQVLLLDASVLIAQRCPEALAPPVGVFVDALRAVTCEMVKRAMIAPVDQPSASNTQMTAGPYSESLTFANPTGDLYLTRSEEKRLGIGKGCIGSIRPAIHDRDGGEIDDW